MFIIFTILGFLCPLFCKMILVYWINERKYRKTAKKISEKENKDLIFDIELYKRYLE